MKKLAFATAVAFSVLAPTGAFAAVIDNTSPWDGSANRGWEGSGQTFIVDAIDTTLDSVGFYFDAQASGQTFNFTLSDALTGGTTFFSTSTLITDGLNTINIGMSLTAGSLVYALFEYDGYFLDSAHYSSADQYAGGHSFFLRGAIWDTSRTGLDHRFRADFSGGASSVVPVPAALPLFGTGLALMGFIGWRRKRKQAA